ncbi:hypothetical protein EB796_002556 [Bugula neritina]|uniref:SLC39A6 n=1 Tax=Bugula neritina TaxID=10212 RepID=A0A7J7KKJ7_BUGNE|nr:hypothetical protein EB796_002556 [Bugula neritina]
MFHRKTVQSSKAKYTMPTSSKGPTLKLGVFSTEDEVTMASVSDYKQNGSTDISEKPKFVTMYDDRVVKSNLHLPRACRSMPVIDVPNIPTNMTSTKFSSEQDKFVSSEQVELSDANTESMFGHGHAHIMPKSFSSVAYMVMLGDGLHRFTDGLAIGTAFANSLSGGLSTSIAVLFHELPHELGDFAILLKSGMSVKQALACNLFSSSLQLLGSVIGLAIGSSSLENSTEWLFAFAGGIFLYVGLVDMVSRSVPID